MSIGLKSLIPAGAAVLVFLADISPQPTRLLPELQWTSEAHAVLGRARRTRRRGVAVGYAAGRASATTTSSAAAPPPAQQPAATTKPPPVYGPLPLGTVVPELPAGCTPKTAGGVQYYHCGDNHFRAAFQGNNLVYVAATPE